LGSVGLPLLLGGRAEPTSEHLTAAGCAANVRLFLLVTDLDMPNAGQLLPSGARALLTGATGLIGAKLAARLAEVVVLSRDPERARPRLGAAQVHAWSPEDGPPPAAALANLDVAFHLAGEPIVDGRWTAERKRRIRDSRVVGTRHLVAGLAAQASRPRVLVCASAVGYYGDRGDEVLDEASAAGRGFLAEVCQAWEHEASSAEALGIRVVSARIGVVLSREGGALARLLGPFRVGAGGTLAGGRQWMPWIHIDDLVGLLLHATANADLRGAMNAVAPQPVRNRDFTHALARAVHRPAILPVPGFGLRLLLGQMSEVLTASARAVPKLAERTGYVFRHPDLGGALAALLGQTA
jgi:uncharacterized protein (TIGR01777 family)